MKHLLPKEAWAQLQQRPDTLFVDVRMGDRVALRGPPAGGEHSWYEYPDLTPNPAGGFAAAVESARPATKAARCC